MSTYESVAHYIEKTGTRKWFIAKQLGISRFQMTALVHPGRYPVSIDDDLARRIADLLNQPVSYVEKLYGKVA